LVGLQHRIDALLLRRVDKRAGVDDHHVGLRRVIGDSQAALQKGSEHDFGIHQILGAAEGDQAHSHWLLHCIRLHSRTRNIGGRALRKQ
jgi:hypothetical protein